MPGLGRIPFMHPKAAEYPAARRLATMPAKYRSEPWPDWSVEVDQGESGTCTGAALLKMIAGRPIPHTLADMLTRVVPNEPWAPDRVRALIMALYRRNVSHDIWPSNDYEQFVDKAPRLEDLQGGSSTDAAMKTGRDLGFWSEFRWCFKLEEADEWIRRQDGSPILIGINWYRGMFYPDANGFIKPTGPIEGGHELKVLWHRRSNRIRGTAGYWEIPNTWSYDWGRHGTFYLSDEDFDRLVFREDGECAVAVETPFRIAA